MDASPTPAPPAPGPQPVTGRLPAPGPQPVTGPPAPGPRPGHGPAPVFPPAPAPGPWWRRIARPAGVLAGVVAAFGYVGTVDPNEPGHYPVCPLLRLTGLACPGCGGLRSAHAFAHGDIAAAFGSNAVAVVGYALFAVFWVLWTVRAAAGRPLRIAPRAVHWWAIGSVVLVFTVIRNLPFGSALAP